MEVIDTESAILDMDFLLFSISQVFNFSLSLIGEILGLGRVIDGGIGGRHAAVDAMCRCGKRGVDVGGGHGL